MSRKEILPFLYGSTSMKGSIYERKKYILSALVLTVLFFLLFNYLSSRISVAFTIKGQECFPYRFWLIKKGVIPEKGEYVAFKNHRIDARATWVKIISGEDGDRIEVVRVTEEDMRRSQDLFKVYIEEIGKELTIKGFVFLHNSDPLNSSQAFEAFEKDTKGRDLPMIEEGRISKGKYFVSSPAARSYDSRYWGLVDESEIIGKAYPIF
jgi:hypothetical protein